MEQVNLWISCSLYNYHGTNGGCVVDKQKYFINLIFYVTSYHDCKVQVIKYYEVIIDFLNILFSFYYYLYLIILIYPPKFITTTSCIQFNLFYIYIFYFWKAILHTLAYNTGFLKIYQLFRCFIIMAYLFLFPSLALQDYIFSTRQVYV